MSSHAVLPQVGNQNSPEVTESAEPISHFRSQQLRPRRSLPVPTPIHFPTLGSGEEGGYHQAELFYLQKQIQLQTQMIFVMEDGARIQGVVEWYDRHSIKVRGKSRVLIYKAAIKYLYKAGEVGSAPNE